MSLTGPSTVLVSEESVFHCLSEVAYPVPSLRWMVDGQDRSGQAEQTNKEDSDRGITSHSVLTLESSLSVGQHDLECYVSGTDVRSQLRFEVKGKKCPACDLSQYQLL